MLVADASVIVDALAGKASGDAARARLRAAEVAVPDFLHIEVASALRRMRLKHTIDDARLDELIGDLGDLAVTSYASAALVPRVMELRENLTVYDAAYVALAEALGCPLVTFDRGLLAAPDVRCRIERP